MSFGAFQNFLRCQNNKTNYNLVCETLQFLDIMCGSTTGGLGLLGLYINESNVHLIIQTLETLTEYCQGPCQENQVEPRPAEFASLLLIVAFIPSVFAADLHRDPRVQRHRHHHGSDPERHQPAVSVPHGDGPPAEGTLAAPLLDCAGASPYNLKFEESCQEAGRSPPGTFFTHSVTPALNSGFKSVFLSGSRDRTLQRS